VVLHPAFAVLMAWASYITGLVLLTQRDPDGRPTYPTTRSLIPEIEEPMTTLLPIIAIYYAGELVWRERDRRMDAIVDATPMPSWAYVVPKTLALAVVFVAILVMSVLASIAVQLSLDFTTLELGKYLVWFIVPKRGTCCSWPRWRCSSRRSVRTRRWAGGSWCCSRSGSSSTARSITTSCSTAAPPTCPLSDMNGAGSFWKARGRSVCTGARSRLLLLVAAHLMWRRGTDVRFAPRMAHARRRLRGTPGLVAAGAALTCLTAGGYAYYNTNVLNTYRSPWPGRAHGGVREEVRPVRLAWPSRGWWTSRSTSRSTLRSCAR
jgi:hypothetical protein